MVVKLNLVGRISGLHYKYLISGTVDPLLCVLCPVLCVLLYYFSITLSYLDKQPVWQHFPQFCDFRWRYNNSECNKAPLINHVPAVKLYFGNLNRLLPSSCFNSTFYPVFACEAHLIQFRRYPCNVNSAHVMTLGAGLSTLTRLIQLLWLIS